MSELDHQGKRISTQSNLVFHTAKEDYRLNSNQMHEAYLEKGNKCTFIQTVCSLLRKIFGGDGNV